MYKLISKVLANCLSKVLNMVIRDCQHAFVGRRQITDAVLIVNEVVDDMINNKEKGASLQTGHRESF